MTECHACRPGEPCAFHPTPTCEHTVTTRTGTWQCIRPPHAWAHTAQARLRARNGIPSNHDRHYLIKVTP